MDLAVRPRLAGWGLVRVKIWDPQGRIVHSDAPALIGQIYTLGQDDLDVLAHPQTRADISNLQAPENRLERGRGKLLQVYRPIWTPSGRPLLFETYAPYDTVTARTHQLWKGFGGVTLTSLLLLVVLLLPILWRLLDRLKRAQAQREALLQRAVDASTEERRRIAGACTTGWSRTSPPPRSGSAERPSEPPRWASRGWRRICGLRPGRSAPASAACGPCWSRSTRRAWPRPGSRPR